MRAFGSLAQSVEQRTFNPLVERSNRSRPTKVCSCKSSLHLKSAGCFFVLGKTKGCIRTSKINGTDDFHHMRILRQQLAQMDACIQIIPLKIRIGGLFAP